MYVDAQQYLLTASFLAPSVLVSYVVFYWLVRSLAKLSGIAFRLPFPKHTACFAVACGLAPILGLRFIDQPVDLFAQSGSGKSLLIDSIASFAIVAMAEELARSCSGGKPDAKE